jgi:RNA polymerase sigma-70 factor (ECF subfamily)
VPIVVTDRDLAAQLEPERLDAATFEAVYERYRLPVYRYLRARTRSEADALDLAADTFERAFASLGRFRHRDGGVQAWLFRIARNAAIDADRRRRPTVELAGAATHLGREAMETDRRNETRNDVLALLAGLPDDQSEILRLRYAGGLTAREIGAVVGKGESAIQKQIERALATLRKAVEDHD